MRRRRAAAAGRAARGLHGAQSGSSAPAGGAAGRAGSAGIRLPVRCGVQRRHGLYSGACGLLPLLAENGVAARVLPGISSVQLLAARLGRPWQDWTLVSAHGAACDAAAAVCGGRPVFFLTGGTLGPAALCAQLCEAGLGGLAVTVGGEPFLSGRACDAGHRGAVRARCVCTAERAAGRGRAPRRSARRALRTARLHAGRCR